MVKLLAKAADAAVPPVNATVTMVVCSLPTDRFQAQPATPRAAPAAVLSVATWPCVNPVGHVMPVGPCAVDEYAMANTTMMSFAKKPAGSVGVGDAPVVELGGPELRPEPTGTA